MIDGTHINTNIIAESASNNTWWKCDFVYESSVGKSVRWGSCRPFQIISNCGWLYIVSNFMIQLGCIYHDGNLHFQLLKCSRDNVCPWSARLLSGAMRQADSGSTANCPGGMAAPIRLSLSMTSIVLWLNGNRNTKLRLTEVGDNFEVIRQCVSYIEFSLSLAEVNQRLLKEVYLIRRDI